MTVSSVGAVQGLRTGSAGSFVAAPTDRSERGGIKPEGLGDEDLVARTIVAVLFLSSFYSSYPSHLFIKVFRFEGGCVSGYAWRTHPSRPFLLQVGRRDEDAAPQKEDQAGPGDEDEGCLQSQSANRRERRHHKQMVDRHI